jgi:hypothetical protein
VKSQEERISAQDDRSRETPIQKNAEQTKSPARKKWQNAMVKRGREEPLRERDSSLLFEGVFWD